VAGRIEVPAEPVEKVVLPLEKLPERLVKAIEPSNDRDCSPDMARLPHA